MQKVIQIVIADRKYEIRELTAKKNRAWRARVVELIDPLLKLFSVSAAKLTEASLGPILSQTSETVRLVLLGIDQLEELLFSYSPVLEADKEFLEENAYDSELASALLEVFKLAFPFGSVIQTLVEVGQAVKQT